MLFPHGALILEKSITWYGFFVTSFFILKFKIMVKKSVSKRKVKQTRGLPIGSKPIGTHPVAPNFKGGCVYAGVWYSNGSITKQAGYQRECVVEPISGEGSWRSTGH
jgi:hypothetical protein